MISDTNIGNQDTDPQDLARLWENKDIRNALIDRIHSRDASETITEDKVIQEYIDNWREGFVSRDEIKLVMNHPALLKKDYAMIEKVMEEHKRKKIMWAVGGTGLTWLVYNLGFKSNHLFYNFFQKKHRFRITGIAKRVVCLYGVFLGNVYFTDYIYNTQFKLWMTSSKLVEKYHLSYLVAQKDK